MATKKRSARGGAGAIERTVENGQAQDTSNDHTATQVDQSRIVRVLGDVTRDWFVFDHQFDQRDPNPKLVHVAVGGEPIAVWAGAAVEAQFVAQALRWAPTINARVQFLVGQEPEDEKEVDTGSPFPRAAWVLKAFPDADSKASVYRISEHGAYYSDKGELKEVRAYEDKEDKEDNEDGPKRRGKTPAPVSPTSFPGSDRLVCHEWSPKAKHSHEVDVNSSEGGQGANPTILLLSDLALGYRSVKKGESAEPWTWHQSLADCQSGRNILRNVGLPSILVLLNRRLRPDIGEFPLYQGLKTIATMDKLVVLSANLLRNAPRGDRANITRKISWERTAQDAVAELMRSDDKRIEFLNQFGHVVIRFGQVGAVYRYFDQYKIPHFRLIYDPRNTDGSFRDRADDGGISAQNCAVAAAIVRTLLEYPSQGDERWTHDANPIEQAQHDSVKWCQRLHRLGFGPASDDDFKTDAKRKKTQKRTERCVNNRFGSDWKKMDSQDPAPFIAKTSVPVRSTDWSILLDRSAEDLRNIAKRIMTIGVDRAINIEPATGLAKNGGAGRTDGNEYSIPAISFCNLTVVDRSEIETFSFVRNLINQHIHPGLRKAVPSHKRPLCFAIFGPPGSGKSFAAKQIARSIDEKKISDVEFDVSQWTGRDDLLAAQQRILDEASNDHIPLIIFDEFDCVLDGHSYGWLKYFLGIMEGRPTKVRGMWETRGALTEVEEKLRKAVLVFSGGVRRTYDEFCDLQQDLNFRNAKGPDFISRLQGHIDVLGVDSDTPSYMVRRAIKLRSILERMGLAGDDKDAEIDDSVAEAFLQVGQYKHGVRSMRAILDMCVLGAKGGITEASLPIDEQLDMHVDSREFTARLKGLF